MMFPFVSPYLHMMNRNRMSVPGVTPWGGEPEFGTQWDNPDPAPGTQASAQRAWDIGGRDSEDDDDVNDGVVERERQARRRGLYSGLTAAGMQILGAAGSGDWSGGLARGAGAFSEAFAQSRDHDRQLERDRLEDERRAAMDARAERQDERAAESHDLGMETGRSQLEEVEERRRLAAETRERTGKGAAQMAADIRALAAAHPDNPKLKVMAQRADGYAAGDADDVDKLTTLHAQMTDEAFWTSDFERQAAAKREAEQADIAAGVAVDPRAAERRANAELEISRGHLGVARERLTQDKNDRTKQMTLLQSFDRIQDIAAEKLNEKLVAWDERSNGKPATEAQKAQWRQEALAEAQREFRGLLDTSYQYTADGELLR